MQDFLDLYSDEFGENLANLLEANPQYQVTPKGFYNRIHNFIENYIKSKNMSYVFDNVKPYQKTAVKRAEIYQAFYVIHSVDFSILSGYDASSGALVDKKVIEERSIGSDAEMILKNAELLHHDIMGFTPNKGLRKW